MCKATLDFVAHQQSTSLASLLQRRLAHRFQHVVDTQARLCTRPELDFSRVKFCADSTKVFRMRL